MEKQLMEINVAPKSTHGHFVKASTVVCIDTVEEAFFVEGDGVMTSQNHKQTEILDNSLTIPQDVYNSFSKLFERSKD